MINHKNFNEILSGLRFQPKVFLAGSQLLLMNPETSRFLARDSMYGFYGVMIFVEKHDDVSIFASNHILPSCYLESNLPLIPDIASCHEWAIIPGFRLLRHAARIPKSIP